MSSRAFLRNLMALAGVCLLPLAACDLLAPKADGPPDMAKAAMAQFGPCRDEGPRSKETGICLNSLLKYMTEKAVSLESLPTPEGCSWDVRDMRLVMDNEALIYRSLTCKGKPTTLALSAGAQSGSLVYVTSAFGTEAVKDREVVRVFTVDPADPQSRLRSLIEDAPEAERAKCEVQLVNREGWPADALVIGYNAEAAKSLAKDEPNAVCGQWGLDESTQSYWLVRGPYAYFSDLGQDAQDIDPSSFTLVRMGEGGEWFVEE